MLVVPQVVWVVLVHYRSRASQQSMELPQQEQALVLQEAVVVVELVQAVSAMPMLMVFRNQAPLLR